MRTCIRFEEKSLNRASLRASCVNGTVNFSDLVAQRPSTAASTERGKPGGHWSCATRGGLSEGLVRAALQQIMCEEPTHPRKDQQKKHITSSVQDNILRVNLLEMPKGRGQAEQLVQRRAGRWSIFYERIHSHLSGGTNKEYEISLTLFISCHHSWAGVDCPVFNRLMKQQMACCL